MPVTLELLAKPQVLCLGCHGKIAGRKTTNRPIEFEQHLTEFKVTKDDADYDKAVQCITCLDPHRPVKK